jgi:D-alanyl-D-alanine dipeptidase
MSSFIKFLAAALLFIACKSSHTEVREPNDVKMASSAVTTPKQIKVLAPQVTVADTSFVNIKDYGSFILDMKYATTANFLKSKVYDCAECYLRLKTVNALVAANEEAVSKGFRIKLFDCYRPLDIQKRMWKIVPNADYVADPSKGSIHNRGGAVDITLVDKSGRELDMGTPFDHFGPEAAAGYEKLPDSIKANRKLLIDLMANHGFSVLKSEWWHYNLAGASTQKVSNFKWDCN